MAFDSLTETATFCDNDKKGYVVRTSGLLLSALCVPCRIEFNTTPVPAAVSHATG